MTNSSALQHNTIQRTENFKLALLILMFLFFCFFLYFMTTILRVFFTTDHVRENSRYVLFVHMLINDIFYLALSFSLVIAVAYFLYIPVPICCVLIMVSSASFVVTPYNLAVMSVERYIAICHPLRHGQMCTVPRCKTAISIMWAVGILPTAVELIFLSYSVERSFFSLNIICKSSVLLERNPLQNNIRFITYIFSFTGVGLVIIRTYIKVTLVARKVGSGTSSVFKAGKTVMLHGFQLLLCMTSFTSSFTEAYLKDYFAYIQIMNFFLFMCLPRVISPLIYGLRDEVFKKHMRTVHLFR